MTGSVLSVKNRRNEIGPAGSESFAGVLGQCASLAHLNLSYGEGRMGKDIYL